MATRGPERREPVAVLRDGDEVARATCFIATFELDGERRWRGFLASIEPAGALERGPYALRLESGAVADIEVREIRTEPREQAVFAGLDDPPG
jgi:hypothetical protein